MESTRNESEKKEVINLTGDLTIEHASELKSVLMKTIEAADQVEIRIEEVRKVHLAALQLLCSACCTALKSKKNLVLGAPVPKMFLNVVQKAGFIRHMGCTLNPNKRCLWDGGEQGLSSKN